MLAPKVILAFFLPTQGLVDSTLTWLFKESIVHIKTAQAERYFKAHGDMHTVPVSNLLNKRVFSQDLMADSGKRCSCFNEFPLRNYIIYKEEVISSRSAEV